jgi:hypothetical protein
MLPMGIGRSREDANQGDQSQDAQYLMEITFTKLFKNKERISDCLP